MSRQPGKLLLPRRHSRKWSVFQAAPNTSSSGTNESDLSLGKDVEMGTYMRAMIAGFVATVVLSLLMIMKGMMGIMPQLDVISMLGKMAQDMMGFGGPAVAWGMHFMIGTVLWGFLFAILYPLLPGSGAVGKGISFGVLAWLMMMIGPMPMAGAGLFGMNLGLMAPMMTLILHVIFGAVMGLVFARLSSAQA